jgi:hypothetical protein
LLPEYTISGGPEARQETVTRTLFNPTRRPAPVAVQEVPKAQMQRGQFVLTGTTVVEGKATAFVREVKTGKSRRVAQGDNLNGLTVAEVKADRVRLALGDESEEVVLRVAANPRPTPAPAAPVITNVPAAAPGAPVAAAGQPGTPPGQSMPGQSAMAAQPPAPPGSVPIPGAAGAENLNGLSAAQTLLERRRAARAAAAGQQAPGSPPPQVQ